MPISIAALAGIQPVEAGLASGLINTSQQIDGALGIAALSTIATSRTSAALARGSTHAQALVDGFHGAFFAGVILAAVGIVATLVLIRRDELDQQVRRTSPRSTSRPSRSVWGEPWLPPHVPGSCQRLDDTDDVAFRILELAELDHVHDFLRAHHASTAEALGLS